MRGRVLGWDNNVSQGQISGEDGQRYTFARPDWRESYWPARGQVVDFEANTDRAGNIYVLQGSGVAGIGSKDKVAAALLAFFLGCFGAHKFYLNKTGAAVTMLLCGTIGWLLVLPGLITAIIAFVEFIIYLVIDDAEFQRRYVQGNQSWF
ncbi:TM2 domain-containing protein [Sphingomonas mali]|jgi:TM2 domain-containing membrane protein YozV|uniref:TM2 domain-containing protein n=1 Tax=Sphingomonas mali TaxID=40682 RepID=UPI00082EC855|nr:TM2 domain-containing protein [Sphingomonas mali]